MGEDLERFFVNEKPVKILIALTNNFSENYPSRISDHADTTYSHTVRILNRMEEENLITSQKQGRKKKIELTQSGEQIARKASQLLSELKEHEKAD